MSSRAVAFGLTALFVVSLGASIGALLSFATQTASNRYTAQDAERDKAVVERAVTELQKRIVGKTPEGWHRKDMDEWCAAFNTINAGVKCPDPRKLPSYLERTK